VGGGESLPFFFQEDIAMRFSTVVGIFAMFTLASGLVFADPVIDDSKNPGYLFVLSATSGSLEGDTLTLNGVPNVVYFSDRPARVAGHMSLSAFIEMWDEAGDSFEADPPNATLSVLKEEGEVNVVVELISAEQKDGSAVFKVNILDGKPPATFSQSAVFVDPIKTIRITGVTSDTNNPDRIEF